MATCGAWSVGPVTCGAAGPASDRCCALRSSPFVARMWPQRGPTEAVEGRPALPSPWPTSHVIDSDGDTFATKLPPAAWRLPCWCV
jgi:hypothetical protein